jgi:hypothetical protein
MVSFEIKIWAGACRASALVLSLGVFTVAVVVIVCLHGSNTGCRKIFNIGRYNQTNNESDEAHYEFDGGTSHGQKVSRSHLLWVRGEG